MRASNCRQKRAQTQMKLKTASGYSFNQRSSRRIYECFYVGDLAQNPDPPSPPSLRRWLFSIPPLVRMFLGAAASVTAQKPRPTAMTSIPVERFPDTPKICTMPSRGAAKSHGVRTLIKGPWARGDHCAGRQGSRIPSCSEMPANKISDRP